MSIPLIAIGGGFQLAPPAAASFLRASSAGCPVAINSAYRDPVEQQRLRELFLAGKFDAFVAPVEKSEHVRGNALDLKDPAIEWMRAHPDYGWVFTDPSEDWHAAHRIDRDRHLADPATLIAPSEEEDDMLALAKLKVAPEVFIGNGVTRRHVTSPQELADIQWMMRNGVLRGDPTVHEVASIGWLGKEV